MTVSDQSVKKYDSIVTLPQPNSHDACNATKASTQHQNLLQNPPAGNSSVRQSQPRANHYPKPQGVRLHQTRKSYKQHALGLPFCRKKIATKRRWMRHENFRTTRHAAAGRLKAASVAPQNRPPYTSGQPLTQDWQSAAPGH